MIAPGRAPCMIADSIDAAPGLDQSLVSTSQRIWRIPYDAAVAATCGLVSRDGGRKHVDFGPCSISQRTFAGVSVVRLLWSYVWLPIVCPSARTRAARSGSSAIWMPSWKNVAFAWCLASTDSTIGVQV